MITLMTFREAVNSLITVPVEKIIFRRDKYGENATVYFHGKACSAYFEEDRMDDAEMVGYGLKDVENGSFLMVEAARQMFGDNWANQIKIRKAA